MFVILFRCFVFTTNHHLKPSYFQWVLVTAVHKFTGTGLITGSDRNGPIFFILPADCFCYFDKI